MKKKRTIEKKLSDNLNSRERKSLIIKPFAKHGLAELTKGCFFITVSTFCYKKGPKTTRGASTY